MKIGRKIFAGLAVLLVASFAAIIWLGSNFALRPPWYEHRTPEQGLLPATDFMVELWNWVEGDPLSSLGLAFEEVEFPAVDGSTLRGWWIPAAAPGKAAVGQCCQLWKILGTRNIRQNPSVQALFGEKCECQIRQGVLKYS